MVETLYKSKNGISVSTINDNLGVPISFAIASANTHDSKIILNQMDHMYIDTNTKRMRKNNRYKQYIYADSGYDTIKIKNKFKKKGYSPIIDPNIRSTIDEQKLQKYYKAKKLYKTIQHKRIVIENSYAWFHKYPKLNRYIEKSIKSYGGLLLLGSSITVTNKYNNLYS